MGKLVSYISILVAIDLLFLITGQLGTESTTSIIIGSILDPSSITFANLWKTLILTAGIGGLTLAAGVFTGIISRASEVIIFIPIALGLSVLVGDFISVFNYLRSFNLVLATLVMAPIIIIFVVTILEWLRNKD